MPSVFQEADSWYGGFYELSLLLTNGSAHPDSVLRAIWRHAALQGPFMSDRVDPADQSPVPIETLSAGTHGKAYGIATLEDGSNCPCGSVVVDDGSGIVWVSVFLPMGGLAKVLAGAGAFPFSKRDEAPMEMPRWRVLADRLLVDIGKSVYRQAAYRLGIVGFETYMLIDPLGLDRPPDRWGPIPSERWEGFLVPEGDVTWLPPTMAEGPFLLG